MNRVKGPVILRDPVTGKLHADIKPDLPPKMPKVRRYVAPTTEEEKPTKKRRSKKNGTA